MRLARLIPPALAVALCAGGLLLPLFTPAVHAQDTANLAETETLISIDLGAQADSADGWAGPRTEFTVVIEPADAEDRLAFVLGSADLTDLFRRTADGWTYRAADLPLPVGEHSLIVYRVEQDGSWTELTQLPLQVMSARGFTERTAGFTVDLDAHGTYEDNGTDDDGEDSTDEDFAADLQLAANARLGRTDGGLDADIQIVGASDEERALQAGSEDDPDQLDLASYLVRWSAGRGHVELGHTSYGSSRLLVDGFASRGLNASLRIGEAMEVSAAVVNGSQIVGWGNPFGLDRSTHRILAGGLGFELVPSMPGAFRVDLAYLDGSVEPLAGFNQGEVNDAEESDGWSVEIHAATPAQRLRFGGGFARSNFTNPADPFLDQGAGDLVPVEEEERDARFAEVDLGLVQGVMAGGRSFDLTLSASHQRVDPLYRSVASFVQSDLEQNRAQLDLQWGGTSAQAFHVRSEDNLDEIPSILKTETRISGAQVAIPFADFAAEPSAAMPTFSLGLQRTTQEGQDLPTDGGFSPSHIPNQVSEVLTAGLDWGGAAWQAGLRYESTTQDNRQPGREDDDFDTSIYSAFWSWAARMDLDLGLELSHERFENEKLQEIDITDRLGVNLSWRPTDRMSWTNVLSWTDGDLRPERGSTESLVLDSEWSWRFLEQDRGAHGTTGQLYIRYSSDDTDVVDRLFGFDQKLRRWVLVSGITLSLR